MEQTCPNCNCDVEVEELKRNNLRCPTCGFDMAEVDDPADLDDEEDEDEDEGDEDEEDEEDEE